MPVVRRLLDWLGRPHVARVALVAIAALAVTAVSLNAVAIRVALTTQVREREGRAIASTATCAVADAVSQAGRKVLLNSSASVRGRLARNLRRLGYPPVAARRAAAVQAASAYVADIRARVEKITGQRDLVRPDGSLDCDRLRGATQP